MGGAPPPPLGAAPQAPKIRKNSGLWGPDLAGFGGAEDHAQRGEGGAPDRYPDPPTWGGRERSSPPSGGPYPPGP